MNRKTTLIGAAAILAAIAIAAASLMAHRPLNAAANDAGEGAAIVRGGVALRPFRSRLSEAADGAVAFTPEGDKEAGVELFLAGGGAAQAAVFFELGPNGVFNIREDAAAGPRYSSSTERRHVLLGGSGPSSALIYSKGFDRASIRIVSVEPCGGAGLICGNDGSFARSIRLSKLAPALSATAYQGADVSVAEEGRRIDVVRRAKFEGEFGVTLRLAPAEKEQRVAAVFDRTPPQGVSLSRKNKEGLAYLPTERRHVVLEPGDEALFFTGAEDRFSLKLESVSACAANNWRCRTREEFEELLPPAEEGATKLDRALQLLAWTSKNADFALTKSISDDFNPASAELHKIYFRYFDADRGGGFCGGTAVFLGRLFVDQGIEAFTWNFGVLRDDITHVTTVVPIDGEFFILDATFGGYLADSLTGKPIDLFKYLDGSPAEFIEIGMTGRKYLAKINEGKVIAREFQGDLKNCVDNKMTSIISCEMPDFGIDAYLRSWSARLARNGIKSDASAMRELMLRGTFGVAGGRSTPDTRAFARKLNERGIPFIDVAGMPSAKALLQ